MVRRQKYKPAFRRRKTGFNEANPRFKIMNRKSVFDDTHINFFSWTGFLKTVKIKK